jgi:hypothetical protein
MINNQLVKELIAKYGEATITVYCKIEADKNRLASKDFKTSNPNDPNEYEYEAQWWENKYKELTINQL